MNSNFGCRWSLAFLCPQEEEQAPVNWNLKITKIKKKWVFSFRGGGSGGVGCLDGVWVWISPIAKRSKSSNDLGRGRGDPGLNLGGGLVFFEACFFEMANYFFFNMASFYCHYSSLHIYMFVQWEPASLWMQLYIFLSISPWQAAFGNHLMKMCLQLDFSCCTSILPRGVP